MDNFGWSVRIDVHGKIIVGRVIVEADILKFHSTSGYYIIALAIQSRKTW
jgi:hypothetical protein